MKKVIYLFVFSICIISFIGISQVKPNAGKAVKKKKKARIQYGTASFYHNKFNGRKTASGDVFSQKKLTAAHNNVPLGTWVRVTNLNNNKSVIVKVIDRLHVNNKRLIDLSKAAATRIGFVSSGLLPVRIEVFGKIRPGIKTRASD